jgi:hypothetical protein
MPSRGGGGRRDSLAVKVILLEYARDEQHRRIEQEVRALARRSPTKLLNLGKVTREDLLSRRS